MYDDCFFVVPFFKATNEISELCWFGRTRDGFLFRDLIFLVAKRNRPRKLLAEDAPLFVSPGLDSMVKKSPGFQPKTSQVQIGASLRVAC